MTLKRTLIGLTFCLVWGNIAPAVFGQAPRIANPGFERVQNHRAFGWDFYGNGYALDRALRHSGATSIRCMNRAESESRGAQYSLTLNQKSPAPLLVTGWSRAENASGSPDADYSLYVDLEYTDGMPLWGQIAAFDTGTHGWQKKQVLIVPAKPIRKASIYVLFRHHTGTAWFDDVSGVAMSSEKLFDSQPLSPPRLASGTTSGWFARDVAKDSPILPLLNTAEKESAEAKGLHLRLTALRTTNSSPRTSLVTGTLEDTSGKDRAIILYYVERFASKGAVWWDDIRQSSPVRGNEERNHLTRVGAGAVGSQSLYPFGCVTDGKTGRGLGIPPALGPKIMRIGYHAGAGLLYIAYDLALTAKNTSNRNRQGFGSTKIGVARFGVDPRWGFRSAAQQYYDLFPDFYRRRATAEGIWIPFTDPAKVERVQDFGIAYHEGDNSVESDDHLGILSFRYTEPMTYWMPMPESVPRTYDAALAMIQEHANGSNKEERQWAEAVLSSGSRDTKGRFNVEFRNTPWANGAVFALNPNPHLRSVNNLTTKAKLNYPPGYADKAYGPQAAGKLDGEYLDSIEGWANVLDYRPESIRDARYPPTFDSDTRRPVIPTWFSVYEETEFMRNDLHRRGKLLMANATPWSIYAFSPLLDVMGTETNWLSGDKKWEPESDSIMCYRRTLSYRKPYLLLQNTDFDALGPYVERYFQRSMFYGIYPSFFSIDAANSPYWQNPKWYNRDRPLFKKYIPVIRRLFADGWEPVTLARSSRPKVLVERFGSRYLTVLNDTRAPATTTLTLDSSFLGGSSQNKKWTVTDMVTGREISRMKSSSHQFPITVAPDEAIALEIKAL
jgi:hypothetical protein